MRIAIFNNYKRLFEDPKPAGIKNIIGYSDNIGNLVFLESIAREVGADSINTYDFIRNPNIYEEKYDLIILSLANMISENYKLSEEFITSLEKIKIPICIFSIGIQANKLEDLKDKNLNKDVLRILNLANKSGTTIGLRGEITENYLNRLGIKNTQVIGCPSLFYDKKIPVKNKSKIEDILVSGSFNGNWRDPLFNLYKFGFDNSASNLVQSESRILLDKYKVTEEELKSWNLNQERLEYLLNKGYDYLYYCHKDLESNKLSEWFINNSLYFNDFDEWLNSMKKFDMHLGVRFHGSVMSTLAEVPTMILSGDLRVKEFVEYHKLPNMDIFELEDNLKPEDVYEKIDYTEYSNKYDELKLNYINFLKKNGIDFIR